MRKIIDGSLDKIHDVQEKMHQQRQGWSWEKEKEHYRSLSEKIARELNTTLVKTEAGTLKFVKNK